MEADGDGGISDSVENRVEGEDAWVVYQRAGSCGREGGREGKGERRTLVVVS